MSEQVVVVGAGIGGLATALRLAAAGHAVTVLERAATPGGKMRTVPSEAGPVDAGPTVLTMRHVFDELFACAGHRVEDHIRLHREPLLARHYWPDGSTLDLWDDPHRSAEAVGQMAGAREAKAFLRFSARAKRLFEAFDAPVMQADRPRLASLVATVLSAPRLALDLAPGTLSLSLRTLFRDARLRQLFGRYSTYVGGAPSHSPAVLALIWQAEEQGVWRVEGGMSALAAAVAHVAETCGATFHYNAHVARIEVQGGRPVSVLTEDGARFPADHVVFAGDPRALTQGYLGEATRAAVPASAVGPRSHSALVGHFAARATLRADLPPLIHHNVFFAEDTRAEFGPLLRGQYPLDPTVYICAEDRGHGVTPPQGLERFETIINAPPCRVDASPTKDSANTEEIAACLTRASATLSRSGLTFDPGLTPETHTSPAGFETLFPGSAGSLYGRSPHGQTAALKRPTAQTAIPGLILAGGGAHPGAGVPMAALSGKHAAAAIARGQTSTSMSTKTDMPGGMSTGSVTMANRRSRSSDSSAASSRPGTGGPVVKTRPTTAA